MAGNICAGLVAADGYERIHADLVAGHSVELALKILAHVDAKVGY
jgi:hypothetical protein